MPYHLGGNTAWKIHFSLTDDRINVTFYLFDYRQKRPVSELVKQKVNSILKVNILRNASRILVWWHSIDIHPGYIIAVWLNERQKEEVHAWRKEEQVKHKAAITTLEADSRATLTTCKTLFVCITMGSFELRRFSSNLTYFVVRLWFGAVLPIRAGCTWHKQIRRDVDWCAVANQCNVLNTNPSCWSNCTITRNNFT